LFFDYFFKYITYIGDGFFTTAVVLAFLFHKLKNSLLIASTYAISSIIAQIIKVIVAAPRPKLYFKGIYDLHFVQGVDEHSMFSFPSGHSASTCALVLSLTMLTDKRYLQIFLLVLGMLTAYSRIYLSQHFLIDVVAGTFIGVSVVLVYSMYHDKIQGAWTEKSIIQVFKERKQRRLNQNS
jgi:membrane-associated phospholipid phosphatase